MAIKDDGDIVRAVGFVAIYGSYLEEKIAFLIEITHKLFDYDENIMYFSATEQTKHLLKALKKAYEEVPDYWTRMQDYCEVIYVLPRVKSCLKKRHIVIHSPLTSSKGGDIIKRYNRRIGAVEAVKSKEIYNLADEIFALHAQVHKLKYAIRSLLAELSSDIT